MSFFTINDVIFIEGEDFTTSLGDNNDIPSSSTIIRVTCSNNLDAITGVKPIKDLSGSQLSIANVSPSNNLVLKADDPNSSVGNRLFFPDSETQIILTPLRVQNFRYFSGNGWFAVSWPKATSTSSGIMDSSDKLKLDDYPNYLPISSSLQTRTPSDTPTSFQISTTREAMVVYTIQINTTLSMSGGESATVFLEISPDDNVWTEIGRIMGSNDGMLTVGLSCTQSNIYQLFGYIPVGSYVRLRTSSTGSPTITYIKGQETLL